MGVMLYSCEDSAISQMRDRSEASEGVCCVCGSGVLCEVEEGEVCWLEAVAAGSGEVTTVVGVGRRGGRVEPFEFE